MTSYPKVKSVQPLQNKQLRVTFETGANKVYDCSTLLKEAPFSLLNNDFLFQQVHTDQGGYGISWNDDIDLSESELWINGKPE